MQNRVELTEEAMLNLEACIPELAESALNRAYLQALTDHGSVLEARDGQLVEVFADGQIRFVCEIDKPVAVDDSKPVKIRLEKA
jgi:hypothetical protein